MLGCIRICADGTIQSALTACSPEGFGDIYKSFTLHEFCKLIFQLSV